MIGKRWKAAVNFDVLWYWAHCYNILLARAVKHLPTGCWTSACYILTHHDGHTSRLGHMQKCVNLLSVWRIACGDEDTLQGTGVRADLNVSVCISTGKWILMFVIKFNQEKKKMGGCLRFLVKLVTLNQMLDTHWQHQLWQRFYTTLSTFHGRRRRERCCPQSSGCRVFKNVISNAQMS